MRAADQRGRGAAILSDAPASESSTTGAEHFPMPIDASGQGDVLVDASARI